jgi:mono/diheme cytochrome c family protein
LWALGAAFAIISCITGYLLSVHNDYDDTAVALHMWCGIAVAAVSLLLLAKVAARQNDAVYKGGAITLFILITATGHFGGSLTHGSDYLFAALSSDSGTDSVGIKPLANVQEAQVYADVIKPIFQTKCYNCHGPQKQKGKLRLDDTARILKGGEDGPVVLAGNAENSDLVKALLLPREDKKHMPPKEKPQLTEGQVALIHWWIDQGAPFGKRVAELPQSEKLKPVLAALQHAEVKKPELAVVPTEPVAPADAKAIGALRKKGVIVIPVAQNSNYLMANFSTVTGISDTDMTLLLPLKKQLVWLKLGGTTVSDSALNTIGQCTNLYSLWLNNTAITDAGLKALQSLKNLQTLNLVGTTVTANGVLQLQVLKNLKNLYLYQTKIDSTGMLAVKKVFSQVLIDTGGYTVPTLASDTTEVTTAKK